MENEPSSLDDILNGAPAAEPEPAVEPEAEPAAEAQPRDENGRFAPKGEQQEAATPPAAGASPAPKEEPPLEHPALIGERRRRQEAERKAQELEQQIASLRQPPQPAPSVWEDEEGAFRHFGGQVSDHAINQSRALTRIDTSEMLARQAHADFQEMYDLFNELAAQNPLIVQQALSDPHPWNRAYQIAKTHKTMQDIGATDIDALKAQLREELKAEALKELQSQQAAPSAPPTLSAERSAGQRGGPAWAGPVSMDDLLRH